MQPARIEANRIAHAHSGLKHQFEQEPESKRFAGVAFPAPHHSFGFIQDQRNLSIGIRFLLVELGDVGFYLERQRSRDPFAPVGSLEKALEPCDSGSLTGVSNLRKAVGFEILQQIDREFPHEQRSAGGAIGLQSAKQELVGAGCEFTQFAFPAGEETLDTVIDSRSADNLIASLPENRLPLGLGHGQVTGSRALPGDVAGLGGSEHPYRTAAVHVMPFGARREAGLVDVAFGGVAAVEQEWYSADSHCGIIPDLYRLRYTKKRVAELSISYGQEKGTCITTDRLASSVTYRLCNAWSVDKAAENTPLVRELYTEAAAWPPPS